MLNFFMMLQWRDHAPVSDIRPPNNTILDLHAAIVHGLTPHQSFKAIAQKLLVLARAKVWPASLQLTLSGDLTWPVLDLKTWPGAYEMQGRSCCKFGGSRPTHFWLYEKTFRIGLIPLHATSQVNVNDQYAEKTSTLPMLVSMYDIIKNDFVSIGWYNQQ